MARLPSAGVHAQADADVIADDTADVSKNPPPETNGTRQV